MNSSTDDPTVSINVSYESPDGLIGVAQYGRAEAGQSDRAVILDALCMTLLSSRQYTCGLVRRRGVQESEAAAFNGVIETNCLLVARLLEYPEEEIVACLERVEVRLRNMGILIRHKGTDGGGH